MLASFTAELGVRRRRRSAAGSRLRDGLLDLSRLAQRARRPPIAVRASRVAARNDPVRRPQLRDTCCRSEARCSRDRADDDIFAAHPVIDRALPCGPRTSVRIAGSGVSLFHDKIERRFRRRRRGSGSSLPLPLVFQSK